MGAPRAASAFHASNHGDFCISMPSMRRPVSVKSVFLLPPCEFLVFEPSRLCRHPSIRTLLLSDFRSVPVGRPRFSRCCYLIIDLGFPFFDGSWARTWSQSPELGG